jgi:hypothetical protein
MVEKRYEFSGENIVIRHKNEPRDTTYGNHSAWFDDGTTSINLKSAYNNKHQFPDWLQKEMADDLIDASLDELKELLEFLAKNGSLICSCGRVFPKDNAVSTGFAGVKCSVCAREDAYCPESEDNKHNMKVLSGKNNARMPTKRKCTKCGYKNQTPPTG